MKASDRGRNVKSKEFFGCFDEFCISIYYNVQLYKYIITEVSNWRCGLIFLMEIETSVSSFRNLKSTETKHLKKMFYA